MNRSLVAAVALAAGLAGCGGEAAKTQANSITANVLVELRYPLFDGDQGGNIDKCAGALEYSDIDTGSAVTIKDAKGTVVGAADLVVSGSSDAMNCIWKAATKINSSSKFFTAEVGGWRSSPQRVSTGVVTFHLDTLDEQETGGVKPRVDPSWTKVGG